MDILFLLRKNVRDPQKPATVYCRITLNGKRANGDFSTFIKVHPDEWSAKDQRILSRRPEAIVDNETLGNIRISLKEIYNELTRKQKPISAQIIKEAFIKRGKPTRTFLQIFREMIDRKRSKKLAVGTIKHNESKLKNTERFLASIHRRDLLPEEFTIKLADDFEYWLFTTFNFSTNHVMKHLQLVKQVLKHACRQQYITNSPLQYLELSFDKPKYPVFLTSAEVQALESYRFGSAPLQKVADIYLFQCYTGFAYVDYITFHPDQHIMKLKEGEWLFKTRQKSGETAIVPFAQKARRILEKYNGVLPVIANQTYNRLLKEVAQVLGINKRLTTHTARKTAATSWLNAGVPEETVARMLGQNTTQLIKVYARILPEKIAEDTKVLNN